VASLVDLKEPERLIEELALVAEVVGQKALVLLTPLEALNLREDPDLDLAVALEVERIQEPLHSYHFH
jgi:hypothetical protein